MLQPDARVEDAELERMLREYQIESKSKTRKKVMFMEKPLDLPYYKGIQLPNHLKWITVQSVSSIQSRLLTVYSRNAVRAS